MWSVLWVVIAISQFPHAGGCMPEGEPDEVTIGKETYVCVSLSPLDWYGNGTYLRVAATPVADSVSSVNVANAWSDSDYSRDMALSKLQIPFELDSGMGVTVSSMGKLSYQAAYRAVKSGESGLLGVTFPLLMAIIYVDKGKVTGITWDSSCGWCDADECGQSIYNFDGSLVAEGGNCFVRDSLCDTDDGTTRLCELNVHIVWTGTDSEDRYFLSATPRFSRLTAEQIVDFTNKLDSDEITVDFAPTGQPSSTPTIPTGLPSAQPSNPTAQPTLFPSGNPTGEPTSTPSLETITSQDSNITMLN